jgi:hypothetical protein
LTFYSAEGRPYRVSLPNPSPGVRAAYLFAYAKSGSTLMNNLVTTYCQVRGVPTLSVFDTAFGQGIPTQQIGPDAAVCFEPEGVIYTGFRHYPAFDLDLRHSTTLLLVRDPRDMLVSMYYSMLVSHPIPEDHEHLKRYRHATSRLSIDEFVVKSATGLVGHFNRYQEQLRQSPSNHVYKYESVVFDKANWLTDMIQRLDLEVQPQLIQHVAKKFDIVPDAEDPAQHIRQVHPGDHRAKLEPATIGRLDQVLAPFLSAYGYP